MPVYSMCMYSSFTLELTSFLHVSSMRTVVTTLMAQCQGLKSGTSR